MYKISTLKTAKKEMKNDLTVHETEHSIYLKHQSQIDLYIQFCPKQNPSSICCKF